MSAAPASGRACSTRRRRRSSKKTGGAAQGKIAPAADPAVPYATLDGGVYTTTRLKAGGGIAAGGQGRDARGRRMAPSVTLDSANQTTRAPAFRCAALLLPRPLWRLSNSFGIVG